eukprot:TRINITY_DN15210_c0_g1_i1.p1 TRINITY_DN15210_c0_g1~~TRINITY_DN15210_c0_g1_i1.p1  ORF type:complete len:210 (-),score=54.00 TRINITY_DN15210_c0_g1_i1:224-853(-)
MSTVRQGRNCERVTNFVTKRLEERGVDYVVFDPAVDKFPLLERAYHHYQKVEEIPEPVRSWGDKLKSCDGIVVVSGEYNHAAPPALKNFLDHFGPGVLTHKASGIVCYSVGPAAGVRAAVSLRPVLSEIGCPSVPMMLPLGGVNQLLAADGTPDVSKDEHIFSKLDKFLGQVEWYSQAFKTQKENFGTPEAPKDIKTNTNSSTRVEKTA